MPIVNWTAENDRKLLIQLEPPTLRDSPVPLSAAQYLATMFMGATAESIARRMIQLRGETKSANGPLSAPGQIEVPRTRSNRPRGKPFRSPITGKWFTIAAAPKGHKRKQRGVEKYGDDRVTSAPKRLRWNIHENYKREHLMIKRAVKRAEVLEIIDHGSPEIINIITPSTTASFRDTKGSGSSIATTSTLDRP